MSLAACVAACGAFVSTVSAFAQDRPTHRIGFVAGAGGFPKMAVTNQTFFDALAEVGYPHGKVLDVVFRTAEGNMSKMPTLVKEVLDQNVEILVVSSSPGCAAAKEATATVPVLCISVQDDPIKAGLTTSLARGTGNVVGVHSYLADGMEQQLGWLQRLVPDLRSIGVLYNPGNATHVRQLAEWSILAEGRKVKVVAMPVASKNDLDPAIKAAKEAQAQIGIGLLGADTYALRKEIAEAARAQGFPIAMDTPGGYTHMGGVATIGVDIVPYYRRGALEQMVPMLKGIKPADLAWIGPDKIDVRVNGDVARAFGVQVPAAVPVD
ncbi:hypothetical protein SQ03_03480 [Methylobacterium platani JCM 14648]|uniref:ABC transporter substrate-binding protein n=2 Tax=Methylobacterium platani TaxID=427683 RepID=A0A179SF00_9HYPH|nr:hypothetical protein SQ03_03480 [Methylobacterium platani JCM 14648]OAS25069.1 hypothetical protein A5481_11265 [Methylobacterium platani]